jgi:fibro-slime domain-containing protein
MKEKIKRISSSTWALILALMMVVSSFSVLAATTNVNKTGASLNSGETIYLKPSENWLQKDAKFGLYVWNDGQTAQWVVMNDDDNDGYYSASVPSGGPYANVIFLRLNANTSEPSGTGWPSSYIWNQTADLIREDGKNCYAVTEGTWDKGGGTWSTYSASKDPVATSVSLTSNATDGKIAQGKDLILSATATGKVSGDVTYTFYKGNTQVGDAQTASESTATTTVSGLSAGDYTFTVKVTKDGYTEVASDPINVTVTGGDGYFLYNDNGGKSFKTSTSLGEFSSNVLSLDLDAGKTYYLYVVKNNDVKNSYFSSEKAFDDSNKSVTLYDYGTNNFSDEIVFTPETSGKYKFTWTPGNGQGTLKYELESTPVAKSVNLTANPENVVVGGSTTLTANVTELNSGAASNVKYTFTEVKEDGTTVGTPQELSTDTATFTDLTNGKHYYKVTVSADGYTSVTATVEVNVNQPYNVTAKYKITENGVTYEDKDSNKDIVSVNGEVTSNTSSGTVVAKNTITNGSSTYVFAGWESKNGSFTDASKASTTFSPSADADVYAKYKKQYTVSASAPGGNGTINVEKDKYLAGDKVTININPNPGYQLKSLKRTTGISGATTDVKAGVSNNKYVVDNISSDETFVAEFEGNPLDCSMYQLLGDFDGGSWAGGSGLAFTSDGKAVITLTSSRKQFKFYNTVAKTQYGSKNTSNEVVTMGTEYTTTKGDGSTYRIDDTGTFIIEIVDIDSNGVPKFKVTKDDTISNYQLYISEGRNKEGTLLGNFTKAKDGTYQRIITVEEGTHYFYIKDSTSTDSTLQYSDGMENCELGKPYLMNRRYDIMNIQYKLSAGSYKVTYGDIDTNGQGKFKIDSLSKPLAESVALSSSATAVKIGNKVTLKAQINNNNVEKGATYTYTFYDGEGKEVGKKVTTELTASCETTSNTKGVVSYKVVVSTNATYIDPDYPTVSLTYTDVSSETIQVDYREKILYIAKVNNDGTLGTLYPLTADSFKPADGVQSVTIAVFSDKTISDDTVCNLTVSESKNKYATITSSTIDTDDVAGIPTYTINCNEGASSPTIYIVDDNIYAVATFDMGTTNTFDNSNKVDYYFAEPTDDTDISKPTTGDGLGLRIYYWNNSVADKKGYADVTTKVDKDGKDSGSNTITVNMKDLYSSGVTDSKTFNVYKVSLPVWATSFKFVSSGTTEIDTLSTFVPNKAGDASIGLNPNRIYLLYKKGSSCYSRGVVLDSSFWTKTPSENNDVPTKNFKANAVNYNTQYDAGGNVTNTFNTYLNALYDTAYANPLFFGYVKPTTTEVAGNQNFRIQDNLAMRHDDNHAYYASVQGLAGNTLSSTSKNENGCGYLLTADGSGNMPLFDYDKLKNNTDVASSVNEGLNFPFNESTFNGITTYSYDSFTDKNRVIDGDFKVDTYSNATVGNDKGVGFFPFDNSDSTKNANKYGFGTEFDIDFYMSETGKLTAADGTQKDITFNFSGDDDVWVYVDGVLVLDLGGAHKVSSGSINFSDMKVIYKAAVDSSDNINSRTADPKTDDKYATDEKYVTTVDLAKIFKANGAEFNNKNSSKKHTLQMFYMERGSFDSNCSVSFNLPQNTGLLVRNDVNFDSVNPGLKDATMGIANKDYFSYMIENKYASDAEFDKLKGKYVTLPNKTTSDIINNNGNFTFDSSNPLYPIVTTDNIIRRVVNGTTYYLAVKNDSGKGCESYWSTHLKDAYTGLPSINFSLPDDFAKLENSTDENNSTAVSGQTDTNGGFNLLFNQSAKFNSKIPSNTMVKVVQNETLYEVNAGDSNTAMSVATSDDKEKVTRRNVSNFYSTSYKITDDKSQKVITEAKGNKDSNVFSNDTSAGTDGFYFADYSENHSDSSAMTVNFTNTVSTSDIKIIKKVTSDNSDNKVDPKSGDRFTFAVKLSNIFGDKDDTMLNEYENLTYKVYDSSTGKLEGTRTYGKSGVSITANEYAVITGIPVGTHYEVTEKQRTGYQFDNVTGEFVATTLNSTKAGTQTNGIKDTDFISCNDSVDSTISTEAETVTGNMPIANDANNAGKTVQLTYTNKEAGFTISFKYYDREVKTGTVAHINTKPTVVNYVFSVAELAEYQNQDGTYDYARMITKAVTAGRIDPDNVIDSYKCFTSQADAETGIQNEYSYRDFVKSSSTYKTYGTAYPKGNFKNHTDCYGRLQGSDGATVSDGEDWVSYYNGKTKYETETDAKMAGKTVTSITVWFFNNLKSYKPTFHYATAINELSPIGDTSKFVGTKTNIINPVFYNVRLGVANGVDSIDEEGSYLKEYGVTGFTGTYSGTAMSIQNGKDELKFLYWSYDENGKSIASNSYKYGYRITNNIKLYAIYGNAKDNTNPGLTVSMNSPDYHKDSNGIDRVRLNTVMNVYNCPDDDPNIKNVAVIYILDPNNYIQSYINENNTTALSNIRTNVYNLIKANGSKAQFSGVTIQIDGKNDNKALGLTYTASKDLLTNKNRVQFTTDFKQSALASQKIIYTFSAMNYYKESATEESKTDWIVSDNCIKYIFDATGKVTGDSTQVNCLQ